VDINPNAVFEEIAFDPRLAPFERIERETRIKTLGYSGPVATDALYQRTLFEVVLPRHWDDLDALG
jgi:hypothetical protein